jgi:hypothetical protein
VKTPCKSDGKGAERTRTAVGVKPEISGAIPDAFRNADHDHGLVVKGRRGWRATCDCGWTGPWRNHPLDAGHALTEHALERAAAEVAA